MNNDEPWVEFAQFCVQMEEDLWMQGLLKEKGAQLASEGSLWRPTHLSLKLLRVSTLSLHISMFRKGWCQNPVTVITIKGLIAASSA